jgi:hypothetical protein
MPIHCPFRPSLLPLAESTRTGAGAPAATGHVGRWCRLPPLILAASLCAGSGGDERSDPARARALVDAGEILPLEQLLERARRVRPGELVGVELEYEAERGGYVYEIELLDRDGRVWELELEAKTGELIEVESEHSGR